MKGQSRVQDSINTIAANDAARGTSLEVKYRLWILFSLLSLPAFFIPHSLHEASMLPVLTFSRTHAVYWVVQCPCSFRKHGAVADIINDYQKKKLYYDLRTFT